MYPINWHTSIPCALIGQNRNLCTKSRQLTNLPQITFSRVLFSSFTFQDSDCKKLASVELYLHLSVSGTLGLGLICHIDMHICERNRHIHMSILYHPMRLLERTVWSRLLCCCAVRCSHRNFLWVLPTTKYRRPSQQSHEKLQVFNNYSDLQEINHMVLQLLVDQLTIMSTSIKALQYSIWEWGGGGAGCTPPHQKPVYTFGGTTKYHDGMRPFSMCTCQCQVKIKYTFFPLAA